MNPSPQAILMQMAAGAMLPRCIYAVIELGIPDTLAAEPATAAKLAEVHQLDADAIGRLMRALVAPGVFLMDEAGAFTNGPLGEVLRAGVPGSVRDYLRYAASPVPIRAWDSILDVLRTGQPGAKAAFGVGAWEFFEHGDPEVGRRFHAAMTSLSAGTARSVAAAMDLSAVRHIVDVGGGAGVFLAGLLMGAPHLRGTLFDQASALQEAPTILARHGVTERVDVVAGSFFEAIPSGADLYVLKSILHDWPDADATRILDVCRAGLLGGGELWLVETVLPPGAEPHPARFMDLHMLMMFGGRERTRAQWDQLLGRSGLRLTEVRAMPAPQSVLVVRAA